MSLPDHQLTHAIECGDLRQVDALLASDAELRKRPSQDASFLGAALRRWFPVLFGPCENLEPEPVTWLLDHGADPNRDELAALLDADASLVNRRYPELDCGASGGRLMEVRGGTLLHVAAEYGFLDACRILLDRGADVNARALVDEHGVGGQTPIFHALTHFGGTTNVQARFSTCARPSTTSCSR